MLRTRLTPAACIVVRSLANATHSPYDLKMLAVFSPCMTVTFETPIEPLSLTFDFFENVTELSWAFCAAHSIRNCDYVMERVETHMLQWVTPAMRQQPELLRRKVRESLALACAQHGNLQHRLKSRSTALPPVQGVPGVPCQACCCQSLRLGLVSPLQPPAPRRPPSLERRMRQASGGDPDLRLPRPLLPPPLLPLPGG